MQYSIKELSSQWISKSLVYEALKNSLPFSHEFIKNRIIFNEKDLEIFKYYKDFWVLKTVSKYWTADKLDNNQPIWKQSQTVPKQDIQQFWNNEEDVSNFIKKTVSKEIEIVKKQFENREEELLKEIEQKNNVIQIKDNQTQKYALLKVQEEKEKKEWIEKYEQANDKKGEWIRKFYWVRTYLIIFIFLFWLSVIFSVLLMSGIVKF